MHFFANFVCWDVFSPTYVIREKQDLVQHYTLIFKNVFFFFFLILF